MTGFEPHRGLLDTGSERGVGFSRAGHHDDGKAERAGRVELGAGGVAAGILGDENIDPAGLQKFELVRVGVGASGEDRLSAGRQAGGRVDAAGDVVVLRGVGEWGEVVAAYREQDALGGVAEEADGLADVGGVLPSVARLGGPLGAAETQERRAGDACGLVGVGGDPAGEWMGGVDQGVVAIAGEVVGQALGAAEATGAPGDGRQGRGCGDAGEREHGGDALIGREETGQRGGFRRAAEDENGQWQVAAP